ncbi:hypothetical protein [Roseovarius salinarum]|uniref:hypothetical protein n=1 Tax=Roseovarius salinarum TaxID=1981892 RepID=UPI001E501996|nr:hypothetical protein [Roseovarius salinarum]
MRPISAGLLAALIASAAPAQTPMSAIDWLDDPVTVPLAPPRVAPSRDGVTDGISTPPVTVTPLGETRADAVGLLAPSVTGLPPTLWQASGVDRLRDRLERIAPEPLPAMQELYYTLLLAEAEPPAGTGQHSAFLQARIDALTALGAVQPAEALLERAGAAAPGLFSRWFDLSLLLGREDRACAALRDRPESDSGYAARIFCAVRAGDWPAAALTYDAAMALGMLDRAEARLLGQFLDPESAERALALPPPESPSPLVFRLFEAVGRPLPTATLPRAYAHADLRGTSGWKAELEAAERLARVGALSENRLLGLYTERKPAASGGVWDRAAAIQRLDATLEAGRGDAIATALAEAWPAMRKARLEVPVARLYGMRLHRQRLGGEAGRLATRLALLSSDYEAAAGTVDAGDGPLAFAAALALGRPTEPAGAGALEAAIVRAFTTAGPDPAHAPLIDAGRLGEAILAAANQLDAAAPANAGQIGGALRTLRAVGLEDSARRAALQLLLLEWPR